jgi:hypothetical protein
LFILVAYGALLRITHVAVVSDIQHAGDGNLNEEIINN